MRTALALALVLSACGAPRPAGPVDVAPITTLEPPLTDHRDLYVQLQLSAITLTDDGLRELGLAFPFDPGPGRLQVTPLDRFQLRPLLERQHNVQRRRGSPATT